MMKIIKLMFFNEMVRVSTRQSALIERMFFVHRDSFELQLMYLEYKVLQFKYDVLQSIVRL